MAKAVEQKLSQHAGPLQPRKKLATIFKRDPKEETIHIIVRLPETGM